MSKILFLVRMISLLMLLLLMYLSICFLTLVERKFLGYVQNRKGPLKLMLNGLLQPVVDGGKLLMKLYLFDVAFFLNSLCFIILTGMLVTIMSNNNNNIWWGSFFVYMLIVGILLVYLIFVISWSAKSFYSTMGGLRSSSQMIAYDVILFLFVIFFLILFLGYGSKMNICSFFMIDLLFVWLLVSTIETNRSPYDFAEGESELVSGFNIEYMGVFFAFSFIAEYGVVILHSWLSVIILFNFFMFLSLTYSIIMIRGFIPRSRYDLTMDFCWKSIFIHLSYIISKLFL